MSDFGISHLAVGQADVMLGRVKASLKPIGGHSIPVGSVRPRNRVRGAIRAVAPAVQDTQYRRF